VGGGAGLGVCGAGIFLCFAGWHGRQVGSVTQLNQHILF
jgi:hypothetical protein